MKKYKNVPFSGLDVPKTNDKKPRTAPTPQCPRCKELNINRRCARDGFGRPLEACAHHLKKKALEGLDEMPPLT